MKTCRTCKVKLERVYEDTSVELGGHDFVASLPALRCPTCKETLLDAKVFGGFERSVAMSIVELGICSGPTFRFLRKAIGLRAVALSSLMGITAETVSRWENEQNPVDHGAMAILGSLFLDHVQGKSDTRRHLEALQHPKKLPRTVHVNVRAA